MRLKFWHDAIDKIYNIQTVNLPDHPVVRELASAIHANNLSKLYFSRLIKSRERPANTGFVTTKDLEKYAEDSVSSVYYLLANINNVRNVDVDHAVSHLGKINQRK